MLKVANSVISASRITGVLPVVNGGTGVTTSTGTGNTVLSASPTLSGDVNLSTGNLVIGTAGKGVDFSITSSGSGTMTSELLSDYEEGTWTPTLNATGFSGATYSAQLASYTKVGRQVTVQIYIGLSALVSGGSNYLRIEGLPFATNSVVYGSSGAVSSGNLTGGSSGNYIIGTFGLGQTEMSFSEMGPDGVIPGNGMQGSRLTATSYFVCTATYITA